MQTPAPGAGTSTGAFSFAATAPRREESGGGEQRNSGGARSSFLFPPSTKMAPGSPGFSSAAAKKPDPLNLFTPAPSSLLGAGRLSTAALPPRPSFGGGDPPMRSMLDAEPAASATAASAAPTPTPAASAFGGAGALAGAERAPPFGAATPATGAPTAAAAASSALPPAGDGAFDAAPREFWVTAFGYPSPSLVPQVLSELTPPGAQAGLHRVGAGPWVHVRCETWQAQQAALSKNGRVIAGFMLGVIAGIHPAGSILPAATLASGAHVGAAAAAPVPLRLQPARGAAYHVAPPHSTAATAVARPTGSLASLWVVVAKLCEILFGW